MILQLGQEGPFLRQFQTCLSSNLFQNYRVMLHHSSTILHPTPHPQKTKTKKTSKLVKNNVRYLRFLRNVRSGFVRDTGPVPGKTVPNGFFRGRPGRRLAQGGPPRGKPIRLFKSPKPNLSLFAKIFFCGD